MWKVLANVYRAYAFVFREQRNGFIKCPACKGSGMMSCGNNSISNNRHSLSGQFCWFCEGHGILPVTGLRGLLLDRTSLESQTQDMPDPRNQVVLSTPFFSIPWSSGMTYCKSVKVKSCLKTEDFNSIFSKSQDDVLNRPEGIYKAFYSATLLVSLLASVISNSSIDSQFLSFTEPLKPEGEDKNAAPVQLDTISQTGSKQCCWEKWRCLTLTGRRRNHIRVKVVKEAEDRARLILESLIRRESESSRSSDSI